MQHDRIFDLNEPDAPNSTDINDVIFVIEVLLMSPKIH